MRFRRPAEEHDPLARPVLVVEDDAGLRAYLATILEEQGYRVIAAGSGEEALRALGGQRAMLAVLDVAEHLAPDVPVIVVTGDPLRAKMRAYGRSSRLTILSKPVTHEQFNEAL